MASLVAVTNIKHNGKFIPAGTTITSSVIDDKEAVKTLVAAGAVAPPKSATAEAAKDALEARDAAERRAKELEKELAETQRARAELEAEIKALQEEHEKKLAEALAKVQASASEGDKKKG